MFHDDVLLSISQKPVLLPPENPYPRPRVRVFRGRDKGRRFLPAENPCHSLSIPTCSSSSSSSSSPTSIFKLLCSWPLPMLPFLQLSSPASSSWCLPPVTTSKILSWCCHFWVKWRRASISLCTLRCEHLSFSHSTLSVVPLLMLSLSLPCSGHLSVLALKDLCKAFCLIVKEWKPELQARLKTFSKDWEAWKRCGCCLFTFHCVLTDWDPTHLPLHLLMTSPVSPQSGMMNRHCGIWARLSSSWRTGRLHWSTGWTCTQDGRDSSGTASRHHIPSGRSVPHVTHSLFLGVTLFRFRWLLSATWRGPLRTSGESSRSMASGCHCYGTASCLISSHLINHASPILSNELFNTSVWLLWNSSSFNLLHFIIVWSCGHYYKVWQLLGITPHCWLNAKPLLHTAYTQILSLFSQTIFLLNYFLICSFFHTLSSYLLIFLSLTHLIAGSYPIGGYLDHILLDDKPRLV